MNTASDGGRDELELWYRAKHGQVQHSVHHFESNAITALVREAETAGNDNDLRSIHRSTSERVCGGKLFDDPVKDMN